MAKLRVSYAKLVMPMMSGAHDMVTGIRVIVRGLDV